MEKLIDMYIYLTGVFVTMCVIGWPASIWINRRIRGGK